MARLVDADEVLRMLKNCKQDNPFFNGNTRPIWETALDCAISCVEVKAIEVVQCENCKHYNGHRHCYYFAEAVLDNDYCSYGERRDYNDEKASC